MKKVTHVADENPTRLLNQPRLPQAVFVDFYLVESVAPCFAKSPRHCFGIAFPASCTDLCAASHWIPGIVGPFDCRAIHDLKSRCDPFIRVIAFLFDQLHYFLHVIFERCVVVMLQHPA